MLDLVLNFEPFHVQVGSTKEGLINAIDVTVYGDCGWTPNEHAFGLIFSHIDNGEFSNYSTRSWQLAYSRESVLVTQCGLLGVCHKLFVVCFVFPS